MLTRLFALIMVIGGLVLGVFGVFMFLGYQSIFQEALHYRFVVPKAHAGVICLGALILLVSGLILDSLVAEIRKSEQRLSEQISNLSLTTSVEAAKQAMPEPSVAIASHAVQQSVEYFYGDGLGNRTGPLDYVTMRRLVQLKKIGPETPVFSSDSANWLTLADFPELAS
jgi:GYF domain 2